MRGKELQPRSQGTVSISKGVVLKRRQGLPRITDALFRSDQNHPKRPATYGIFGDPGR